MHMGYIVKMKIASCLDLENNMHELLKIRHELRDSISDNLDYRDTSAFGNITEQVEPTSSLFPYYPCKCMMQHKKGPSI